MVEGQKAGLVESLLPGGFLLVGYSESLRDVAELQAVSCDGAVVYRRRATAKSAARASRPAAQAGV